jgi:glucokinase
MTFLGIEIGGTKLQIGIGPGDGTLAGLWRGIVDPAAGAEGIRRQIGTALPELLARAGVDRSALRGVGIGFGGPINDATATVIRSHQIAGWDDFPLADWISDLVGLPAVLGNDADVAGLAEALFGAGQGVSPIFYVTLGSGIGGGLILGGEIYRGCGRGAAEIGHLTSHAGVHGFEPPPLEESASGWAIAQRADTLVRMHTSPNAVPPIRMESVLRAVIERGEPITARHVADAAARQDQLALGLLDAAWSDLALALCNVIALLCPRRIVIGGGVSLMGEELLFEPLRQKVAEAVFPPFAGLTDIVPAALGEEVVVHGALALARKRLGG